MKHFRVMPEKKGLSFCKEGRYSDREINVMQISYVNILQNYALSYRAGNSAATPTASENDAQVGQSNEDVLLAMGNQLLGLSSSPDTSVHFDSLSYQASSSVSVSQQQSGITGNSTTTSDNSSVDIAGVATESFSGSGTMTTADGTLDFKFGPNPGIQGQFTAFETQYNVTIPIQATANSVEPSNVGGARSTPDSSSNFISQSSNSPTESIDMLAKIETLFHLMGIN